jgi:hypothetical protein
VASRSDRAEQLASRSDRAEKVAGRSPGMAESRMLATASHMQSSHPLPSHPSLVEVPVKQDLRGPTAEPNTQRRLWEAHSERRTHGYSEQQLATLLQSLSRSLCCCWLNVRRRLEMPRPHGL